MEPETQKIPVPEHIPIYKEPFYRQVMRMHALMADEYFWAKFMGGVFTGFIIGMLTRLVF
jgi:hypothetical protein